MIQIKVARFIKINSNLKPKISNSYQKMNDMGEAIVEYTKQLLIENNHNATGDLVNSVRYTIESNEDGNLQIKLYANNYFKYINEGRGPGPAPFAPIFRWVKAKGIRFKGLTHKETAWAVRGGLIKNGFNINFTKPLKYKDKLKDKIESNSKLMRNLIRNGYQKDIQDFINQIIIPTKN